MLHFLLQILVENSVQHQQCGTKLSVFSHLPVKSYFVNTSTSTLVTRYFGKVSSNWQLVKDSIIANYLTLAMYYELFDNRFCTYIEQVSLCMYVSE